LTYTVINIKCDIQGLRTVKEGKYVNVNKHIALLLVLIIEQIMSTADNNHK
jgi:hypothetical protein